MGTAFTELKVSAKPPSRLTSESKCRHLVYLQFSSYINQLMLREGKFLISERFIYFLLKSNSCSAKKDTKKKNSFTNAHSYLYNSRFVLGISLLRFAMIHLLSVFNKNSLSNFHILSPFIGRLLSEKYPFEVKKN